MFGLLGIDWGYGFDPYRENRCKREPVPFTIGQQFKEVPGSKFRVLSSGSKFIVQKGKKVK